MTTPRRTLWLFTTLTVVWTSLWPLVSSAHALLASEPVELCHQAGMQVAPGEMPMKPGVPEEGKQHCPLCVMAFYGSAIEAPSPLLPSYFVIFPGADTVQLPLRSASFRYLPPSRAPPSIRVG